MRNPFDRATEISIEHPKKVLAIGFVSTLLLSSMAMFLEFDNSEDAFFPDNETVRLLDEVESEYQASICLLYTSPSPRDQRGSRMPASA